ncbi:hypothetical protein GCM10028820_08470 [Tessaracoccus terricola]
MDVQPDARGILYPTRLPSFHRIPAPKAVAELVQWFWIPRWQLAPGRTSRQEVLTFPASNLTVEPGQVTVSGPTTRISHRDLTGTGWAVGALLRPAGVAALGITPSELTDSETQFEAPDLHAALAAAMTGPDHDVARDDTVAAYVSWLGERAGEPDESALAANRLEETVRNHRDVVRVEQLAERLHLSVRSVQRLADRFIGVPPLAMIRRFRLQEAAQLLREDPAVTIADVAAELGYSDHAHLTSDFRRVLGLTPRDYRASQEPGGRG